MYKRFNKDMGYFELIFCTLPGITGISLLIIISALSICSMEKVRRRHFQLFSLVHFIGVPAFLILILVHGSESWFNWNFPMGLTIVPFGIGVALIQYAMKFYDVFFRKFHIVDCSLSEDKQFVMIYIKKPKKYSYKPGQYLFLNVPSVSRAQWHPFTIASAPKNKYLVLMIKWAGDWTGKVVDSLIKAK